MYENNNLVELNHLCIENAQYNALNNAKIEFVVKPDPIIFFDRTSLLNIP